MAFKRHFAAAAFIAVAVLAQKDRNQKIEGVAEMVNDPGLRDEAGKRAVAACVNADSKLFYGPLIRNGETKLPAHAPAMDEHAMTDCLATERNGQMQGMQDAVVREYDRNDVTPVFDLVGFFVAATYANKARKAAQGWLAARKSAETPVNPA